MKLIFFAACIMLIPFNSKEQTGGNWYRVYTGQMGNLTATFHVFRSANDYNGYLWFDQNQWPMPVYGSEKKKNSDSIGISAGSGPITVNLTGILNEDSYTGTSQLQKEGSGSKNAGFQLHISSSKSSTPFDYYFVKDTAGLLPKIKNESTCSYVYATIWPRGNTPLYEALKNQVRQILHMPATLADPGKWLLTEARKSTAAWKKENGKLSPKEASEMGLSLSVEVDNRVVVMYENENYITLAHYEFSYTGGAHGNYGNELFCINKHTAKAMRLSDVITAKGISLLPVYLDRVARFQYGIKNNKPLDQNNFLVKQITPSKNFYITSSGIGFLYAPYEIKSFADGEVNLLIPFTALKPYLQPGFKP